MDLQVTCLSVILITTLLMIALTEANLNADTNPQIVPSKNNRDNHQPITMNQQRPQHQGSRFRDKQHVQDKDHILEHLENVIEKKTEDMTEEELQLHYFKMHDYDNNNKLDGLELIQALTHFHHDEDDDDPGEQHKQEKPAMSEKELIDLIDPIFDEEDENKDGYIDYPEFARSQL